MIEKDKIYTKEEFLELLNQDNKDKLEQIATYSTSGDGLSLCEYYCCLPHNDYCFEGAIETNLDKLRNIPKDTNWQDKLGYFTLTRFNEAQDLLDYFRLQLINLSFIDVNEINNTNKDFAKNSKTDFRVTGHTKDFYEGYYAGAISVLRYLLGDGKLDRLKYFDEFMYKFID